ncbi:MAG: response regulator [Campylobacterota bacterium]|nr:response regulator [Campylobacterota bacterium]
MKNKTILVVDDAVVNLDILGTLLVDYDVIGACSGEDVFSLIKEEEKIDIILLDIIMPDIDGYEVCKKLKANNRTKDIPVIFITAKTDEESVEKAYEVGGVDYITKPFRAREVLARVKSHLTLHEKEDSLKQRVKDEVEKNLAQEKNLFNNQKLRLWVR